jgi:hypothetical protein
MMLRLLALLVLLQLPLMSQAMTPQTEFQVIASRAGAHLDSNLMTGGGTDDTEVLQRLLDGAVNRPVHLIIDGAALVRGLNVYGNTTIECTAGGGLYLKDGSARAIIRNAHRSRDAIVDKHIQVKGCFLNGNRMHQVTKPTFRPDVPNVVGVEPLLDDTGQREADGTWISGLQFLGVDYLGIQGVTLWNVRAFGALIANAHWIDIKDVVVDDGVDVKVPADHPGQTDGLHFKGPIRYMNIENVKLRVGDDGLAFNPNDFETDNVATRNDFGPYVGQGPITDVTVSHVMFMDMPTGIRILSTNERIDRIDIGDVVGRVSGYLLNVSHWTNAKSFGNVGAITLHDVNVTAMESGYSSIAKPKPDKSLDPIGYYSDSEWNGSKGFLISVNDRVENLQLDRVTLQPADDRPVLRIGPEAHVGLLVAELNLRDPDLHATPVELDDGGHVDRMQLSLDWNGAIADRGKNPIAALGGTVGQLRWVNTPPVYVDARLDRGNRVAVTFSQEVRAEDFTAGVTIRVNDKPVTLIGVVRQAHGDTVEYILRRAVAAGERVTWTYDSGEGAIANASGTPLYSVSAKTVALL